MSRLLIIHRACDLIVDSLERDLDKLGFKVEKHGLNGIDPFNLNLHGYLKTLRNMYKGVLIFCHPLSLRLIVYSFLALMYRPIGLIYVVPPSIKHRVATTSMIKLLVFRILLGFYRVLGGRVLFVFTTPYERVFADRLLKGYKYVYYTPYGVEKHRYIEPLSSSKPFILITASSTGDLSMIADIVKLMGELGVPIRIIIYLLTRLISKCIDDHRVTCVHSDDAGELINASSLVVIPRSTLDTMQLTVLAMSSYRPVITGFDNGIALAYRGHSGVYIVDTSNESEVARTVIEVLNNLGQVKKNLLVYTEYGFKRDFGLNMIKDFIENISR